MHTKHTVLQTESARFTGGVCVRLVSGPAGSCAPAGSAYFNTTLQGEGHASRISRPIAAYPCGPFSHDAEVLGGSNVHRGRAQKARPLADHRTAAAQGVPTEPRGLRRRGLVAARVSGAAAGRKADRASIPRTHGSLPFSAPFARNALIRPCAAATGEGPEIFGFVRKSLLNASSNLSTPMRRTVSMARVSSMASCPAVRQAISAQTDSATSKPHCDWGVPQVSANTFGTPPFASGSPTFSKSARNKQSSRQPFSPINGQNRMAFPLSTANLPKRAGGVDV